MVIARSAGTIAVVSVSPTTRQMPLTGERLAWALGLAVELGRASGDVGRQLGLLARSTRDHFASDGVVASRALRTRDGGIEVLSRVDDAWSDAAELCRARADLALYRGTTIASPQAPTADARLLTALAASPDSISTRLDVYREPGRPAFGVDDQFWLTQLLDAAFSRVPPNATPDRDERLATLTRREREALDRLLVGDSEKQVAVHLGCSRHTVHAHVKRIYRRLEVNSRAELLALFVERGEGRPNDQRAGAAAGRAM